MNVNPDPRPGRWLLPLVVLGMVTFTYFFVNQLPGSDGSQSSTTQAGSGGSTSSTAIPDGSGTTTPGTDSSTTAPAGTTQTPEVQAYLQGMQTLQTALVGFQTQLSAANTKWDTDPKEISYTDAQTEFKAVQDGTATWAAQVAAVSAPDAMRQTHNTLVAAANDAATQAANAYDGLVNSSTADKRRNAVQAFDDAVKTFSDALTQAGG
jgi:hypothetical protein